jgi:hypothetical protein
MGGTGGVASPSPNAGKSAAGIGKVRQAIDLLNQAVSDFTPGSPQHETVIKTIGKLTKDFPAQQAMPGAGLQGAKDMIMKMLQSAPAAATQRAAAAQPMPTPPTAPAAME